MNNAWRLFILALLWVTTLFLSGCIGFNFPQPFSWKPVEMLNGGAQIGRDQLANRSLAANHIVRLDGLSGNEVLSILGQPQSVQIVEPQVSEDWHFIYYKRYKTAPRTGEGAFIVRFYQSKVIDVVKTS